MTATRISSQEQAKAFNRNVATVETRLQDFLRSGDSPTTAALRKSIARLRTTYSVLPKEVRRDPRAKRYVSVSKKLSNTVGKVRDIDTIAAWTMQLPEGKDQRSFISDLGRLRGSSLKRAMLKARKLRKTKSPLLDIGASDDDHGGRPAKVEKRLARRVDQEFEEFLSSQEVEVMHALRKDSKRLRHLLELTERGEAPPLLARLRSIQDDLGAIRDHDLVIDYLRSRVRLTSTRSLVREEIAKRHARLGDFVTKNRGQGHLIPVSAK